MPSLLSRLAALFPGFRPRATIPPVDPQLARLNLVAKVKEKLDETPSRPRPSGDEKLPLNWHGGVAGKVWFLPYLDSVTKDTPEIRAAMRLMWRDGYVVTAWEPQIRTVASEDWQVQPSEAGNPEAEEQADFCKAVIEDHVAGGMPDCVRAIVAGFGPDGFTLCEPVWSVAERGKLEKSVVLSALKARDCDQSSVRLEGDRFGNVQWVQSARTPGQDRFPIGEFVYSRYVTVYDEPLGMAAFRPAYSSYWMRDTVKKLRAVHHEKRMAGFLVGTYAADDDKAAVEEVLRRAKTGTWASVPEGVRIEALALSTASEPDYKSFDESLRDEIVSAIAFATLQSIQGNVPDARGDSKVQKAMADLGPWFLMARVQEAFNKQIFPKLIDYNFPFPAAGGYPKLTFGAVSNQELMELAQLVQAAQGLGLKPSRKHYAKALSIQEADPNDPGDALGGQQPGMGGMGGGMPPVGGDPFGGGGGGMPPGLPPGPGGGQVVQFSESEHLEVFKDREPVKWERQSNGTWKSSGGRVLSDEAYQRHLARVRGRELARNPQLPPPQNPDPEVATPRGRVAAPPTAGPPPGGPDLVLTGAAVASAVGGAKRRAKAVGRRVAKVAAAGKAGGLAAVKHALGTGVSGGLAYLGRKANQLGSWLADWDWLERNTGVGSAAAKWGAKVADRFGRVKAAFDAGHVGRGGRKLVREVSRLLGTRWSESRKKYGFFPALAVEAAMTLWGFGRSAAFIAFDVATGFQFAGITSKASMLLTGHVRRAVEYPAKLITEAATGKEFRARHRTVGAGRVAQAIEWAAGLSPRAERRARAGRFSLKNWALGVGGSRPGGGEITPKQALEWADAAKEIQRADLEGRPARGLDPATEGLVRRALAVSAEGSRAGYEAAAARDERNAARRARAAARKTRLGRALGRVGMSEAAPADPAGIVLDLREGIDEVRATLGLGPTEATDDELAGSLVVVLEEMAKGLEPAAEAFAEWESFAWTRGTTRRKTVKAVGTGEDEGKTLYGKKAEAALKAQRAGDGDFRVTGGLPGMRSRPAPSRPGKELTDVTQVRKARTRAQAPTPPSEQSATSPALAGTPAGGGAPPLWVPGAAELAKVRAGDPAATRRVQEKAVAEAERATAALQAPPPPAEVDKLVTAGLGKRAAGKVGGVIREFFKGLATSGGGKGISGFLGGAVRGLVKGLARLGTWAVKQGARALWSVAKYAARKGYELGSTPTAKVFYVWAGSIALAAGLFVSPVVLAHAGVIPWAAAAALAPAAAIAPRAVRWWAGRQAHKVMPVLGANRDPLPPARFAEPERAEGEEWETNGRRYRRVNGRTVRVPGDSPPPKSAAAGARQRAKTGGGLGDAAGRGFAGGGTLPGNDLAGAVVGAAVGAGAHVLGRARKWLGFGEAKDLSLAGPDGRRAEELTATARQELTRLFAEKARAGVERLLASGDPMGATVLFTDDELGDIAAGLSRTIATADLLGRARIRRRAKMAEALSRGHTFAEGDDPYHDFAEPVPVLVPAKAIEYVRSKVPEIDPGPDRYGSRLDRHATTMAIAADQTLLQKIQDAIVKELEGGGDATPDIDAILTNAGLHPGDPQYAEFIARSSVNDALTTGASDELQTAEMREAFPAWQYFSVADERSRPHHAARNGKYYPSAVSFGDVRGNGIDDVANCRCGFSPVHRSMMDRVRVETDW